jgi:hypothetical protein
MGLSGFQIRPLPGPELADLGALRGPKPLQNPSKMVGAAPPNWPQADQLQDEPRRSRGVLGPSLAEHRPKTDPTNSGQTASNEPLRYIGPAGVRSTTFLEFY